MDRHNGNGGGPGGGPDAIDGKVVVVTGASGGVGRARRPQARSPRLPRRPARARADGLEGAKRDVEELGGRGLVYVTDVSKDGQVEAAAEAVERAFGPIDVWVNNAMLSMYAPFWELSPDEYRHITDATYLGQVYGTMTALKRMHRATAGGAAVRSCRSGRPWRSGRSRSSRRTAGPSTPWPGSPNPSGPSCSTNGAT